MQSANPQCRVPDQTKGQTAPAEQLSQSNNPHDAVRTNHNATSDATSDQNWLPHLDRRQSWSREDCKHQLQERLLDVEQGRETGFSEKRHGN